MRPIRWLPAAVLLIGACAAPLRPPETAAPPDALKRVVARNGAVTSANGLASDAGVAMLQAGGNAVDAAVATAFAVGVVEPQMSGLGGSGAMLIWRQDERQAYYLDFYAMQNAESFRGRTGDVEGIDLRIVGIPGAVAGLLEAHERFGSLPLEQILQPAIRLAEQGFPVGQTLAEFIRSDSAKLHRFETSRAQMYPDSAPLDPGDIYRNPPLAATLRAIAARGRAGFYEGDVGRAIAALLNQHSHPVTPADLAGFRPQWKRPLCTTWHGRVLLSAPPPQTGAQLLHTLKLLEPFDLPALGLPTRSPRAFDVLVSALRVAQADNRGVNDDPRWRAVPAAGRITDAFAAERRALVGTGTAAAEIETADAGAHDAAPPPPECAAFRPWPAEARTAANVRENGAGDQQNSRTTLMHAIDGDVRETGWTMHPTPGSDSRTPLVHGPDGDEESGETTHMSVVDVHGNAVALTQTNSTIFGSGAWVAGFFLNDSGYRFRSDSAIAGGSSSWRTRTSTIAPTIVIEDGRVRMITGAPGSGRIPTEIAQTMVYMLDYGMDPIDALRMPRIFPSPSVPRVQLEHGFSPALLAAIRAMGYDPTSESSSHARLYTILRSGDRWIAVSDPRHDGEPRGY
ncbi:MAG TPA: gamma-glutamyltransferase family protein [Longimicrobiales bacterium]